MSDEEIIVYREVPRENGSLKEKIEQKKEQPLVLGSTDEEMIVRELEALTQQQEILSSSETITKKNQETQQTIQQVKTEGELLKEEVREEKSPEVRTRGSSQVHEGMHIGHKTLEQKLRDGFPGAKVIDHIGTGGICSVHLIEHTGRKFAYKTVNQETVEITTHKNPEALSLFLKLIRKEAELINQLGKEQPHSFPSFAFDLTFSDARGSITEYIPYQLEEKLKQRSPEEKLSTFIQIASTIQFLHSKGIVLGDIKSSNFRVDDFDNVKLVDLNLKYADATKSNQSSLMNSLVASISGEGRVKGTPRYMAPEQWEGRADERTDVFQLSSLCYELLTGINPEGHFENMAEIIPYFKDLDSVLRKGMSRDADKRYHSVEELVIFFIDELS